MKTRNAMYAAVGAPIVAARALNARLETLRDDLETRGEGMGERAQRILDEWSREGRQAVEKVSEGGGIDQFTSRVDLEQAREQVSRLRDQLEQVVASWRPSDQADDRPATPPGSSPMDDWAAADPGKTSAAESAPGPAVEGTPDGGHPSDEEDLRRHDDGM